MRSDNERSEDSRRDSCVDKVPHVMVFGRRRLKLHGLACFLGCSYRPLAQPSHLRQVWRGRMLVEVGYHRDICVPCMPGRDPLAC